MATPSEISAWFDDGVSFYRATHMAVFSDTYGGIDYGDYPAFIWATNADDARSQVRDHGDKSSALQEVYHLGSNKARQLAESKAMHYAPL